MPTHAGVISSTPCRGMNLQKTPTRIYYACDRQFVNVRFFCSGGGGALSWATFHRKKAAYWILPKSMWPWQQGSNPLQPLCLPPPSPLFNYLSLSGRLAELYVAKDESALCTLGPPCEMKLTAG